MEKKPTYEALTERLERLEREIAEYRSEEEQLRAALSDRDALLNETHHRVKNNLQLISSFVSLMSMKARHPDAVTLFNEINNKIHTMALIHNQLYRSDPSGKINMKIHIEELTSYLHQVYGSRAVAFDRSIVGGDVRLSVNQALPCALALNEIISNAFKHGHDGKTGKIQIRLQESPNRDVSITVGDSGPGLPDDMDQLESDTLGMQLIRSLIEKQLSGTLKYRKGKGTRITLTFRIVESPSPV